MTGATPVQLHALTRHEHWCLIVAVTLVTVIIFRMYLVRSLWTLKQRSAYIHVGVQLVLQWPLEEYHQNHNSAGFLADV
jgi:hypothetical protein